MPADFAARGLAARQQSDLASTIGGKGGSLVGLSDGSTVQQNFLRERRLVADIITDSQLTYTSTRDGSVLVGDIIRARCEGHSYAVVSASSVDYDLITSGGVKLQVQGREGGITPRMVSPNAGSGNDDTAAIRQALVAARRAGVPLLIDRTYKMVASSTTDPVRVQDGDYLRWTPNGLIIHGTYGVPLFWNLSAGDRVVFENARFKAGYTLVPGTSTLSSSFRTYVSSQSLAPAFPNGNQCATLFMLGTDLVLMGTTGFYAGSLTDPMQFLYCGIALGYGTTDGATYLNNAKLKADTIVCDGYVWGVLVWCYDSLDIKALRGERYTMLDPATFTGEAPEHLIYCTGQGSTYPAYSPRLDTNVDSIVDNAIPVGIASFTAAGNNTAKFTQRHGSLNIGHMFSKRRSGCLDVGSNTLGYQMGPISIGPCTWDGSSANAGDYGINKAFRFGVQVNGSIVASVTNGSNVLTVTSVANSGRLAVGMYFPSTANGIPAGTRISAFGTGTGGAGTYTLSANASATTSNSTYAVAANTGIQHAKIGPVTAILPDADDDYMNLNGDDIDLELKIVSNGVASRSNFFLIGAFSNSRVKFTMQNPNSRATSNWGLVRIDSAYGNNRVEAYTDSPDWAAIRPMVENDKASINNTCLLVHTPTGSRREIGGGFERRTVNSITAVALTGASVSFSNLVPKGASLHGVQSIVTTAITGASGYTLGTAADPDMFGIVSSTTVQQGTDDDDWTANGGGFQLTALTPLITASTANFTAGNLSLMVQYTIGMRNGDTY